MLYLTGPNGFISGGNPCEAIWYLKKFKFIKKFQIKVSLLAYQSFMKLIMSTEISHDYKQWWISDLILNRLHGNRKIISVFMRSNQLFSIMLWSELYSGYEAVWWMSCLRSVWNLCTQGGPSCSALFIGLSVIFHSFVCLRLMTSYRWWVSMGEKTALEIDASALGAGLSPVPPV